MPNETSWKIKHGKSYSKLTANIEADVAIIGAGITGIFNAYILSRAGLKVVVLEKNEDILQSVTMRTTAFITKALDSSFDELVELYGEHTAKLVWESGQDAIHHIADIVKKENIDCEFKIVSACTYANNAKEFKGLAEEHDAIKKAGLDATLHENGSELGFINSGFIRIPHQAMFHPLKFAAGMADAAQAAGAEIYTNSEVLKLDGLTVKTKTGLVKAKNVLMATYEPFTNEGTRFKKAMYISYVYELEIAKGIIAEGIYADMNNPYHYFRIDKHENFDRMIVGGEDHRAEFKLNPAKSFNALDRYVKTILGNSSYTATRKWSGHVLESVDGLALIGDIKPHTFVATAFSGNGMTYSAMSAMIIRDLIFGHKNPYAHVYDPKRKATFKQALTKGLDYIGEFFGGAAKNFFSSKK